MTFGTIASRLRRTARRAVPQTLVLRRLPASAPGNAVLLTFDDGPHPDVTPAVLDRLAAHGARAVFFVVGKRIRRAPHLLARIRDEGHLIGNHSLLHRMNYVRAQGPMPGFVEYYRDCARCQAVIERRAGLRPTLFRPPGGRLMPASIVVPRLLGLACVTWSVEVADWSFRTAEEAHAGAAALLARVQPHDIVLLHDDNPFVLDLLDDVLPELAGRGIDLASGVGAIAR